MGKKVLVVGSGGREHAIVDALSRSAQVDKIYCAPGNAGIAAQAECVAIKDTDVEGLKAFALDQDDEPCMCPECQVLMRNRAPSIGSVLPDEELEESIEESRTDQ